MQFEDLKLPSGARMKLMLSGATTNQANIQATFVGALAPRSIIAAVPAAVLGAGFEIGTKVGISMVSATDVVTFATLVEAASAAPFPHLFLSYPATVNVRKVRAAARVNVGVSAQVTNLSGDDPVEMLDAQILDMSVNGLKLASKQALGQMGDELAVHVQLTFDDIVRDIMLTGQIRSHGVTAEAGNPFSQLCGIEFSDMVEDKRVLLYAFVFCMIQRFGPQM
jgi:hypothetical protein